MSGTRPRREALRLELQEAARAEERHDRLLALRARLEAKLAALRAEMPRGRRALADGVGVAATGPWLTAARRLAGRDRGFGGDPVVEREGDELGRARDRRAGAQAAARVAMGKVARLEWRVRIARRIGTARRPAVVAPLALARAWWKVLTAPRCPRQEGAPTVTAIMHGPPLRVLAASRALRRTGGHARLTVRRASAARPSRRDAALRRALARPAEGFVLLTDGTGTGSPGWLARLAAELAADPDAVAIAPAVEDVVTGGRVDGGWSLDWEADGPRLEPVVPLHAAERVAAVGPSCVLFRHAPDSSDHLASFARCWDDDPPRPRALAAPVAAGAWPRRLDTGDHLDALARRWGPFLRRRAWADLLRGGGEWCRRPLRARAQGMDPAQLEPLGWRACGPGEPADLHVSTCDGEVRAVWAGLDADLSPAVTAPTLRELPAALRAELARPSFTLRVSAAGHEAAVRGGDWQLAERLARALRASGHACLVEVTGALGGLGWTMDVSVLLRGREPLPAAPGQLSAVWLISHPDDVADAELEAHELVLVASRPYARELERRLHAPVRLLLQCADTDTFFPDVDDEVDDKVVFVGNWRSEFRRVVWDAVQSGARVALYGAGWDRLCPERVRAPFVTPSAARKLYSSANAVLADHWDDMRRHGFVSNRVFDALACEAFVVCDEVAGIEDELPGALVTYRGADELGAAIDRATADRAHARAVARAGRAAVVERHTAGHRADELLAAVGSVAKTVCSDHILERTE